MSNAANDSQTGKERRIDIGAQVGIARNLAFARGGRTRRLTGSAYIAPRPVYDAPRGQLVSLRPPEPSAAGSEAAAPAGDTT
jgi:hypothetical protein